MSTMAANKDLSKQIHNGLDVVLECEEQVRLQPARPLKQDVSTSMNMWRSSMSPGRKSVLVWIFMCIWENHRGIPPTDLGSLLVRDALGVHTPRVFSSLFSSLFGPRSRIHAKNIIYESIKNKHGHKT